MARRVRAQRMKAEMNVVPYIDVMLVLLVIFMIAAPLMQRSVEINLPEVSEQNSEEQGQSEDLTLPLVLTVDAVGSYYLNISAQPTTAMSEADIQSQAADYLQAHPEIDVYVSGDAAVDYAHVIKGVDYLRAAGARQVNLSSQLPQEPSNESE